MGTDDFLLLYRVVWEQGDFWSKLIVFGGTLAWIVTTLQYLCCQKDIKEDDTLEAQAAKEKENAKISSDSWQMSVIIVIVLVFHWYSYGLNDPFTSMLLERMYQ